MSQSYDKLGYQLCVYTINDGWVWEHKASSSYYMNSTSNLVAGIEVLVDSLARKMITHYMLLYTVEPLHSRHNWEATFCPI